MKCPTCGAEASGRFCEMCGAPLPLQGEDGSVPVSSNEPSPYQPQQGQQSQQSQPYQSQSQQPQQGQSYQSEFQQSQPYQAPYQNQPYQPQPKQASNAPFVLAIIALVSAILGLFPVSLILAIIALAMNSSQKKRGEASSKQTPTFVMGLISIILSVVAAILTALLGGAIWLAVMEGDVDVLDALDELDELTDGAVSVEVLPSSSSASGASESSAASSSAEASSSASSSSAEPSSSAAASSSSSSASTSAAPQSLSTNEVPTLADFQWFTADMVEGKLPKGATSLVDIDDVEGGWKAYAFGTGLERFFNVDIAESGSDAILTFKWGTYYNGDTGKSSVDTDATTTFAGLWAAGFVDASGSSGRVTITDFWQEGSSQYATGSFMWPSGEVDYIAMVRP